MHTAEGRRRRFQPRCSRISELIARKIIRQQQKKKCCKNNHPYEEKDKKEEKEKINNKREINARVIYLVLNDFWAAKINQEQNLHNADEFRPSYGFLLHRRKEKQRNWGILTSSKPYIYIYMYNVRQSYVQNKVYEHQLFSS